MASATITVADGTKTGHVKVDIVFDPPLAEDTEVESPAHQFGLLILDEIVNKRLDQQLADAEGGAS